jgi:tetratricopeptide (TPR) repeat protein
MIPAGLRRNLFLAVFLLLVALPARGEPRTLVITDELQLGLAESFMAEGEYYRAITEYKKFLYFFPDAEQAAYVQLQIGMAYYRGGEYAPAIAAFAKVRQSLAAEHFAAAAFYEGVCRSRLQNPLAARDDFERVVAFDPAAPQAPAALAGLSLVALDREDWAGSRQALERLAGSYADTPQGAAAGEVLALFEEAESRPRKSPVAAGAMSAIVPGSGYAYAGRYRDGLVAFLVNGLFIAGTAVAIDHENYPAAVLIGGAGLPFYLGNIYGSANAAHKWNLGIARDLREELAVRLDFHY